MYHYFDNGFPDHWYTVGLSTPYLTIDDSWDHVVIGKYILTIFKNLYNVYNKMDN